MNGSDQGVLISQGDTNGGYTLYVRDGALHYEYNHQGTRYRVTSDVRIQPGRRTLSVDFARTDEFEGVARLLVDGVLAAKGKVSSTARYLIAWQGLFLGCDRLSPVSFDYPTGFDFSGKIHWVDYLIEDDAEEIAHEVID